MSEATMDIRHTIVPKSDQLNAEQLLGGPLTITVARVVVSASGEQPISIFYDGDQGRPFKPCKTMRKLLGHAWGYDATLWAGRSMRLYNDASVTYGNEEVGGIRISHMSDIDGEKIKASLNVKRGKKAAFEVLRMPRPSGADHLGLIKAAASMAELEAAFAAAWTSTKDRDARAQFTAAKDVRKVELQKVEVPPPPPSSTAGPTFGDDTGGQS